VFEIGEKIDWKTCIVNATQKTGWCPVCRVSINSAEILKYNGEFIYACCIKCGTLYQIPKSLMEKSS